MMQAMVLPKPRATLVWTELPDQDPQPGEVRVRVSACGVCRTDLHVLDGELAAQRYPIIPGHEIVGRIDRLGAGSSRRAFPLLRKPGVSPSECHARARIDASCHRHDEGDRRQPGGRKQSVRLVCCATRLPFPW